MAVSKSDSLWTLIFVKGRSNNQPIVSNRVLLCALDWINDSSESGLLQCLFMHTVRRAENKYRVAMETLITGKMNRRADGWMHGQI